MHALSICILIASALANTALINMGGAGIPLFYAGVGLGLLLILSAQKIDRFLLFYVIVVLISMSAVLFAHLLSCHGSCASNELKQWVARCMFLVNFVTCCVAVASLKAKKYLLGFLFAACVYGVYEFFAKLFGLPELLGWVANNSSYSVASSTATGWVGLFRARSFWAEPSVASFPILILMYLLLARVVSNLSLRVLCWVCLVAFALLTFSRIVYITMMTFLFLLGSGWLGDRIVGPAWAHRGLWVVFILGVVVGSLWPYFILYYFDDLSAIGRSSSIIVGVNIWLDHFFFGAGFNTYEILFPQYVSNLSDYHFEKVVHNTFVSVLYQSGVVGLIAFVMPIIYLLVKIGARARLEWCALTTMIIIFLFSGGGDYTSSAGLLLAILWGTVQKRGNIV